MHTPAWHVSVRVQAFPSEHDVPFDATGFEHAPLAGSHVPAVWHASLAVHVFGLPPVQTPDWHESVCVHAFPSEHDVPYEAAGYEHTPVDPLHVPAVWHWSLATHVTAFPPVHTPA